MIRISPDKEGRWSVLFRALAGTVGAYALASLGAAALSLILVWGGMSRVEAVIAASLASLIIAALITMAVFHARSARRAWLWLIGAALPLASIFVALRAVTLSLP